MSLTTHPSPELQGLITNRLRADFRKSAISEMVPTIIVLLITKIVSNYRVDIVRWDNTHYIGLAVVIAISLHVAGPLAIRVGTARATEAEHYFRMLLGQLFLLVGLGLWAYQLVWGADPFMGAWSYGIGWWVFCLLGHALHVYHRVFAPDGI